MTKFESLLIRLLGVFALALVDHMKTPAAAKTCRAMTVHIVEEAENSTLKTSK